MRRFFWIRLLIFLRQSRWGFVLITLWFALGTTAFHFWEHLPLGESFLNAIYFRSRPDSSGVLYSFWGQCVLFGIVISIFLLQALQRYNPQEGCRMLAKEMQNHVIIVGYTHLGIRIVEHLRRILEHLDGIDLLEVIADDFFSAPSRQVRALKTLAVQIPVVLHGVSLGLASSAPVETKRLDQMARLMDQVRPEFWSEHLAFVRAGGIEIGHLAAPPRSSASVDAAAANLHRAQAAVGRKPLVENIATLIDPPASNLSECAWINGILCSSNCGLLLDLHNVLANGLNHGFDPIEFVRQIPSERIAAIHIAGGQFVSAPDGTQRLLDDHLHDVPDPVFELLEETAARAAGPLTVILERDGDYPSMDSLLAQIAQARRALARGRARRAQCVEALA